MRESTFSVLAVITVFAAISCRGAESTSQVNSFLESYNVYSGTGFGGVWDVQIIETRKHVNSSWNRQVWLTVPPGRSGRPYRVIGEDDNADGSFERISITENASDGENIVLLKNGKWKWDENRLDQSTPIDESQLVWAQKQFQAAVAQFRKPEYLRSY